MPRGKLEILTATGRRLRREKSGTGSPVRGLIPGGNPVGPQPETPASSPGTITGSIGVILGYTNFKDLLKKIGLTPVVIKSGKFKDIGSPAREMTEEEKRILQEFTDQVHGQFIDAVAQGREMERSVVESIADGRIMTGETAQSLGLIDELGNFEDAIVLAAKLANIEGKITKVYPKEKKLNFFKYLAGESLSEIKNRLTHSDLSAQYLYNAHP